MNIRLTEAEIGEAMRRLSANEGHCPTLDQQTIFDTDTLVARVTVRKLLAQGFPVRDAHREARELGVDISLATVGRYARAARAGR